MERNLPIIRSQKMIPKWLCVNAPHFDQELVWISGIPAYINTSQLIMFDPCSVPKRLQHGDCDMPSWSIDTGRD